MPGARQPSPSPKCGERHNRYQYEKDGNADQPNGNTDSHCFIASNVELLIHLTAQRNGKHENDNGHTERAKDYDGDCNCENRPSAQPIDRRKQQRNEDHQVEQLPNSNLHWACISLSRVED